MTTLEVNRVPAWPWMWVAAIGAVVASVGACAPLVTGVDFCLDDAWIHLAYARSLRFGEGFSYNPGDHETGFSSPLWTLLLAAIPPGPGLIVQVKIMGVLLHAATAVLATTLAWDVAAASAASGAREDPTRAARWAAPVAGVLTGTLGHLVQSATSGMEVSLAAALLLATTVASLRKRPAAAFGLAFLGVLARPETLFFSCTFGALAWFQRRRSSELAAPAGALLSLLVWIAYCLAVSGYPWPNSMYVKGAIDPANGLLYLLLEVLLQQPWVLGVTGLAVLLLGLRRFGGPLRWLMAAWLATVLAISLTREVTPGGLFFYYRYYAIVAPIPVVCVAVSLTAIRRTWVRGLAILPVLAVTLLQWPRIRTLQQETEQDIAQLHSKPARYLAGFLPAGAVLLVEGAGAMRYFIPRSVRVVDIVGLNDGAIAHAGHSLLRDCLLLAEHPTHAAIPDEWLGFIQTLFELTPVVRETDMAHHSGRRVYRRQLHVFRVIGPTPRVREACRAFTGDGS